MEFKNKGKWIKQFNESFQRRNEVRYIDPDNLDKYDKDEIEEVTTASGEKRYKRKGTTSIAQSTKQQDTELNKAHSEPENDIDKYSGHNSITASVPVARQTLMDLANKFNGTYNKSKKRVEFKKNSDMQKAIKALRELPAGRFNYVFSSNYFGNGYQVKPKDYNVESIQKNEDKVFVRNMTTGNSYYINKDSFDAHKYELLDDSQQSSTDTQATSLAFEVHDLQSQIKRLKKEVQLYKKSYNDSMKAIDSPYANYKEIERNKQRAFKANELLTITLDRLNNTKAKLTKKQNALKKIRR